MARYDNRMTLFAARRRLIFTDIVRNVIERAVEREIKDGTGENDLAHWLYSSEGTEILEQAGIASSPYVHSKMKELMHRAAETRKPPNRRDILRAAGCRCTTDPRKSETLALT